MKQQIIYRLVNYIEKVNTDEKVEQNRKFFTSKARITLFFLGSALENIEFLLSSVDVTHSEVRK